ncbi:MAG: hypothetical protein KDG89_08980 [Geminicoccaceae bacterium]|nr:hypothetical protein [Geminicoccaceae bacterium]
MKDIVAPVLAYMSGTTFRQRLGHLGTATLGAVLAALLWQGWGWLRAEPVLDAALLRRDAGRASAAASVLEAARAEAGAARAMAFRFHNTTRFLGGGHRLYMSAVSESTRPGAASYLKRDQDVPLSLIAGIAEVLDGRCVSTPVDAFGRAYKSVHAGTGVLEVVKCPILDLNGEAIGLWSLSFERTLAEGEAEAALLALQARQPLLTGLFAGG